MRRRTITTESGTVYVLVEDAGERLLWRHASAPNPDVTNFPDRLPIGIPVEFMQWPAVGHSMLFYQPHLGPRQAVLTSTVVSIEEAV